MSGGLKEVRNRIVSVQSTSQITQAMKMVSAAKLRRAQDAIVRMRPYAEKLQEILSNVSSSLDSSEGVYSVQREEKNVLMVAITSNRGLCGGFNNNVIKRINELIASDYSDANVNVLALGKKANDAFSKLGLVTTEGFNDQPYLIYDDLTFGASSEIAQAIMDQFVAGKYDKVVLVYNQFKNAATQILRTEQMLPVLPLETTGDEEEVASNNEYIFEPTRADIIERIIPNSLKVQLFKGLLDSYASEHGARMTAMHKATDNANDLVKELKLSYNKARQAAITNEILEIVGGAEALNG
ncbi:MAG: ATP synthase F1 subunit gamma [Flavobacteriales bacterium]|nr:ATP synthase F1 subunit gamma [Flavobacteriales bacterium]MDG1779339.1 ATP synthase F1 subunit gamma [Flavobacteriales bacterium]MDG2246306.1 ATP synthase F1 subunit gamma [Flavobacteriales bacterium]